MRVDGFRPLARGGEEFRWGHVSLGDQLGQSQRIVLLVGECDPCHVSIEGRVMTSGSAPAVSSEAYRRANS